MRASIPAVEIPDDADALRVGRPDREVDPGDPVNGCAVRPELFPGAVMRPFVEQVQVEVGEDLTELIGIEDLAGGVALVNAQAVDELVRRASVERHCRLEQAFRSPSLHRRRAVRRDQVDARCRRLHRPDHDCGAPVERRCVTAEHGERVVARPARHRVERQVPFRPNCACHLLATF
jgi:hypothetical protein